MARPRATLERAEVAIVKAMVKTEQYNDQQILAFFTRPTRSINHRVISEIRNGTKYATIKAAPDTQLDQFLSRWPDVDPETGLSASGDELNYSSSHPLLHGPISAILGSRSRELITVIATPTAISLRLVKALTNTGNLANV